MTSIDDDRQNESTLSPLSNRFLVAHSSPVHDGQTETIARLHEDSFQSSSSTSNSKSSSSTTSRSSRLQYILMQHHQSAVNSPLMYSRCTSLGSLASYDIRSSCNESYTSECSSVKPSGIISPSDIPDSPPCEPSIIEEEQPLSRPVNRTLTLNTTSSQNRTTMMSETVIEKTLILNQHHRNLTEIDDDEHLDEVIVYAYESTDINEKSSYENQFIFDDDSYRIFNTQTDETDSIEPIGHENLSIIAEESSFVEDTNSIRILYDLIKKPHWTTRKTNQPHLSHSIEDNESISSNPSSLSLDSISGNQSDDDDEYDQEKGRQLIQRLIQETLSRRFVESLCFWSLFLFSFVNSSLRTDFIQVSSPMDCPTNTSTSSSSSNSTKSHQYVENKSKVEQQKTLQRSQSSPAARPTSMITVKSKEKIVQQTRSSVLRLRQAQQNKRINHC